MITATICILFGFVLGVISAALSPVAYEDDDENDQEDLL